MTVTAECDEVGDDTGNSVIQYLPGDAVAEDIVRLMEAFLSQQEFVSRLPGRLAIVSPGRVRFRP